MIRWFGLGLEIVVLWGDATLQWEGDRINIVLVHVDYFLRIAPKKIDNEQNTPNRRCVK